MRNVQPATRHRVRTDLAASCPGITAMSKKQEPDDKRSFPGYGSADSVFVSWANTLRAQASSWNDLWIKLRAGSAEFGDWTKLWVESAEAFMSLSEQFWYTFSGSAAPP